MRESVGTFFEVVKQEVVVSILILYDTLLLLSISDDMSNPKSDTVLELLSAYLNFFTGV